MGGIGAARVNRGPLGGVLPQAKLRGSVAVAARAWHLRGAGHVRHRVRGEGETQQVDKYQALAVESAENNSSWHRGSDQDHGVLSKAGCITARPSPSRSAG